MPFDPPWVRSHAHPARSTFTPLRLRHDQGGRGPPGSCRSLCAYTLCSSNEVRWQVAGNIASNQKASIAPSHRVRLTSSCSFCVKIASLLPAALICRMTTSGIPRQSHLIDRGNLVPLVNVRHEVPVAQLCLSPVVGVKIPIKCRLVTRVAELFWLVCEPRTGLFLARVKATPLSPLFSQATGQRRLPASGPSKRPYGATFHVAESGSSTPSKFWTPHFITASHSGVVVMILLASKFPRKTSYIAGAKRLESDLVLLRLFFGFPGAQDAISCLSIFDAVLGSLKPMRQILHESKPENFTASR